MTMRGVKSLIDRPLRGMVSFFFLLACGSMPLAQEILINDNFADRVLFGGTNVYVRASLFEATTEPGEPVQAGISGGYSAWWTWIAPWDGLARFKVAGSGCDPLLGVYTGAGLEGLSLVASNSYVSRYESCGDHLRVRDQAALHVTAGQAYHLSVDCAIKTEACQTWGPFDPDLPGQPGVVWTTNAPVGGDVGLQIDFFPAPANDRFENRMGLSGRRVSVPCSNVGAAKEPGEPDHLGNPGGSSIWFTWRAPASGRVTLSDKHIESYLPPSWTGYSVTTVNWYANVGCSCGSETEADPLPQFFPLFGAYTGESVESLASAGGIRLDLAENTNAVAFEAVKDTTYQIAYDGNRGTSAGLTLHLALTKPAYNDDFAGRVRTHGIHVLAQGHNAGATRQRGEPDSPPGSVGRTVWWSWLAPVSGPVSVSLAGSDFPFPVTVFRGSELGDLQPVASGGNLLSFQAEAGEPYQISVGDTEGRTGKIVITIQAPVFEAPPSRTLSHPRIVLLSYQTSPGQVLLLQRKTVGEDWQNVARATAHGKTVSFRVKPARNGSEAQYRAIIVDLTLGASTRGVGAKNHR